MRRLVRTLAALCLGTAASAQAAPGEQLDHGRFTGVRLYTASPNAARVVLWLGGPRGWLAEDEDRATQLARGGALVIGLDGAQLRRAFDAPHEDCIYPAGDLENLSRFVQAYTHQATTRRPVLASRDSALVHAVLAQSPPGHFAGGVTLGFTPTITALKTPLCAGTTAKLANPLVVLSAQSPAPALAAQRSIRWVTLPPLAQAAALQAAATTLSARTAPLAQAAPADLKGLPVIEDRAAGNDPTLAIFWSGDGGWATIDKDVSEALQKQGISVVGVDSLRYFWSARRPEDVARDTAAIARHYLSAWGKRKLLLIGFSQGADVLPFALSRLDPALRARVSLFAALSLSDHAVFEFRLSNWVADNDNGPATAAELAKLGDIPTLCLYGADDTGSVCGKLPAAPRLTVRQLPGDHHFNGDYATLAHLILAALPES